MNVDVEALDGLGVREDDFPSLLLIFVVDVDADGVGAGVLDGSSDAVAREGACVEVGPKLGMSQAEVAPTAADLYDIQLLLELAATYVLEDGKEKLVWETVEVDEGVPEAAELPLRSVQREYSGHPSFLHLAGHVVKQS